MDPEKDNTEQSTRQALSNDPANFLPLKLRKVTPLSKYLAMVLFVILPFLGGWVGYMYAPIKIVTTTSSAEISKSDTSLKSYTTATTTLDMLSYRIHYTDNAIELLSGPEIVQTIARDVSFRRFFADDKPLLITNWDINFDDYLDVGVLRKVESGGVNLFYEFYTFNPETFRLEKLPGFEMILDDVTSLVNPELDVAKKMLTSSVKSGSEWIRQQYFFDGKKYVKEDSQFSGQPGSLSREKNCLVDADCVLIQPDCKDCTFAAMAASEEQEFLAQKKQQCALNPPVVQCDIVFEGEVKCIENTCQLEE